MEVEGGVGGLGCETGVPLRGAWVEVDGGGWETEELLISTAVSWRRSREGGF